jgi:hypothetical protein
LKNNYEGVHQWLVRRWSAVAVGSTSTCALLLSLVIGPFNPIIYIPWQWWWCIPVFVVAFMLSTVAFYAWSDGMRMLTFMIEITGGWHEELIRQRAFEFWEQAGRPEGKSGEHWQQAEAVIAAEYGARWVGK